MPLTHGRTVALAAIVALIVSMSVSGQSGPDAPSSLRVLSVVGDSVTFAWNAPTSGSTPTGYQLEGGGTPGQVLGTLTLGLVQGTTITMPTGSFYVRVRTLSASGSSAASNEILVPVNVAMAPSAPANLLGLVVGTTASFAWTNTFTGGTPTAVVLEVAGTTTGSLRLALTDTASFAGVPSGVYTVTARATNATGSSAASNPVTLTVPTLCSGPPEAVSHFAAYQSGGTIFLNWDTGTTGPAPAGYVVHATGAYAGDVPVTRRSLSAAPGPGVYNLSVSSTNACGTSAPTAVTTVTVGATTTPGAITSVVQSRYKSAVTIAVGTTSIVLRSQGVPDHVTPYWGVGHPMYEVQLAGQSLTPGVIGEQAFAMTIPVSPAEAATKEATSLGPIGMALNGVAIFNDREGGNVPVDSGTLRSFDRAGGHVGPGALYHYHFDGDFTSYDDAALIGFLRDGFPLYGRKDADGSYPSNLDSNGGHVATTADFPTAIYHYHTSHVSYMNSRFYILKSGSYHGTKGTFTF